MKDFVKQYDIKHKIQRLYIHWDVSTQCNFHCTYCYAIESYGKEWGSIDKWFKQKLIINNIGRASLPVFLGLLGGEPTLHPHYDELIDNCYSAIKKHKDGRLYVTTNGSRGNGFFEDHKFYNQMYFLFSFHPEYEGKYGKKFETLVNNITIARRRGFKCKVNVMLHYDSRFWKKTHKFIDDIECIEGLEIHPHWLYRDGNPHAGVVNYTHKFYREFKRFEEYPGYFTFEDQSGGKELFNDYNMFRDEQNYNFKGWNCWHNNYEISWDGKVRNVCFADKEDLLLRNFNFFKNIKKICPVVCPHTSCSCDGLLKIYKERQNDKA
ncbi:hypothetical protein CL622_03615 [archaeon]|nr:hypothetical protein [archaeon]